MAKAGTLELVRDGTLTVDEAATRLPGGVAELGYAHVDLGRRERCGFPEVIFCQGKTSEWVEGVVSKLREAGEDVLATRVSDEQSAHLALQFPAAEQDRVARTFWLPAAKERPAPQGQVFVLTAGTSDLPVAREAVVTIMERVTLAELAERAQRLDASPAGASDYVI